LSRACSPTTPRPEACRPPRWRWSSALRDRVSFGSHRARGVVHGQRRARPGGGHQPAWAARRATPCALARNSSRR
jgi:hypothetical protein